MSCQSITPLSAFESTNLSSKIDSFTRLGQRITRQLGAPLVNVEIHSDQLYECISIACEMYTTYAGYTEEYLVFNSNLYVDNVGIRLDQLFSITPNFNRVNNSYVTVWVAASSISSHFFSTSTNLSATYSTGIFQNQILTTNDYLSATAQFPVLTGFFNPSINNQAQTVNAFDYDIMDYRKVIDVYNFEEGSNNGVNTLFTLEQTLAQQTYFSYAMGNYGFDLISWYTMKNWLDVREKMLAIRRSYTFDNRTQMLQMYPAPRVGNGSSQFWGVIACYVERPLKDIIRDQWVQRYALALAKICIGQTRGKFQNQTLFGGGSLNTSMLDQGIAEKASLEEALYTGSTPGFGQDSSPAAFFMM